MSQARRAKFITTLVAVALWGVAPAHGASDPYEEAISRFRSDDFKGAIVALKSALQEQPRNLPALVLMGQAMLEVGDGAGAEEALRRARNGGADRAIIIVPLGRALLAQRNYEAVLSELSGSGQNRSLQAKILVLQGAALAALERPDEARATFKEASTLDPLDAGPRIGIARLALAGGHPRIAAAHTAQALLLDPDSEEAWLVDGQARRLQGDLEGAVKSYGRAIALKSRYEEARVARAAMLIDLQRETEALADIEFVQARNPRQPQMAYLKALLLSREGKLDEAAALLTDTAALLEGASSAVLEKNAPMLLLAGVVANAQGNMEQARRSLRAFLKLEPEHALARRMLGTVLVRTGEGRLAIDALTPALRYAPNDPVLHATLGVAYRQAKLYKESVASLERAIQIAPDSAGLRLELVRTRLAAGQQFAAIRELEVVLEGGGEAAAAAGALLAQIRLARGDAQGALSAARAAVAGNPGSLRAHLVLGDTLLRTGDAAGARNSYEQALTLDADSLPALYGIAGAEVQQGQLAAAAARYEAMLALDPEQLRAMIGLARVAEADGRYADAVRWLEKAYTMDRAVTGPQIALVDLHLRRGQTGEALRAATQLAEGAPEDIRAVEALARAQAAGEKHDAAKATYRRLRSMSGITAEQLTAIARGQLILQDLEGARESLVTATARDATYLPSQAALVALDLFEKRNDAALTRAHAVRERHPKRALGPMLVGDVQMATERYHLAAASYQEAIAREPLPAVKVKLFQARWQSGRTAEARAGIDAWLASDPDNPLALRQLAEADLAEGRLEKAQQLHERLVALFPDDSKLMNSLAWIYQKRGDPRALATAEHAIALAPESVGTLDTYGWVLLESGQPEQALKVLRKAQVRAAKNPWVKFHTALALSRLGRNDEARELLKELIASGVPFEKAQDARSLLDKLSKG